MVRLTRKPLASFSRSAKKDLRSKRRFSEISLQTERGVPRIAKVLVYVFSQHGHVNPTLKLPRGLRSNGHEVVYAGARSAQRHVERNALCFVCVEPPLGEKASQLIRDSAAGHDQIPRARLLRSLQ